MNELILSGGEQRLMKNRGKTNVAQPESGARSAWILLGSQENCDYLRDSVAITSPLAASRSPASGDEKGNHGWTRLNRASLGSHRDSQTPRGEGRWTAGPNVEVGDRLLFYFRDPLQEIRFVATASSNPFKDDHFRYDDGRQQWRVRYTGLVEIEPIPRTQLESICGENRLLLNTSCRHLRPDFANQLLRDAKLFRGCLEAVRDQFLAPVAGRIELGTPETITLEELRQLKSEHFLYEDDVERHFVEPLVRLIGLPSGLDLKRRLEMSDDRAVDYVIQRQGVPRFAIEAKKTLSITSGDWNDNKSFHQVRRYADELAVPFALIDRELIACFKAGASRPHLIISRTGLSHADLTLLREVLCG
ncbi:MAG: hypothetical protein U0939_22085 [Pirellulales bacterium]